MSFDWVAKRRRLAYFIFTAIAVLLAFAAFIPNLVSYKIESSSTVRLGEETTVDDEQITYLGWIKAGESVEGLCDSAFHALPDDVSQRDGTAIADTARLGLSGMSTATCVPVLKHYDDLDRKGAPQIYIASATSDAAKILVRIDEGYGKELGLFISGILGAAAVGFLIEATKPKEPAERARHEPENGGRPLDDHPRLDDEVNQPTEHAPADQAGGLSGNNL